MRAKEVIISRIFVSFVSVAAIVGLLAGAAVAVNIETVPVGNAGNVGELSGSGEDERICGSVGYTYNIGKYEVTTGQYTEFLNAVAGVDSYGLYSTSMWSDDHGCQIERFTGSGTVGDPYQYRVAGDWANRPVNYVSWGDAARFANWLHNGQPTGAQNLSTTEDGAYCLNGATSNEALMAVSREADWKWAITSEDEWYKAAYHKNDGATGNYFDFPTSSDSWPSNALIDPDPGNNANFMNTYDDLTLGHPYYRTEVGAFENSDSLYGTFDQGGNVWEWNESVFQGSQRCLRGGSFQMYADTLWAGNRYYDQLPSYELYDIGFRVAEVPEPTSLAILALGGLGLISRRRPAR